MLYIVSTPIGNLRDITLRAIDVLRSVDLILAEDTRETGKLLKAYDISVKTCSFHSFNESSKEDYILDKLRSGLKIALVSDAGTPSISDPGYLLVKACRSHGIPVSILPGPSSVISAIAASGLDASAFQFLGFAPKKDKERDLFFLRIAKFNGLSCFFESPHRLLSILEHMPNDWTIFLAKEMTKIYETFLLGSKEEILQNLDPSAVRGEFVLVIQPNKVKTEEEADYEKLLALLEEHLPHTTAAKIVGKFSGKGKKSFY